MNRLIMFVDDKDYEDGSDTGCPDRIAYAIDLPDNWTQDDIYVLYEEFRKIDDWAWRGDSFLDWLIAKGHGEAVPILEIVCYPRFGEGEGDCTNTVTVENTPNMPTPYPTPWLDGINETLHSRREADETSAPKFDTNARQGLATNLYNDAKKKREDDEIDEA